jgi:hypothetical protein
VHVAHYGRPTVTLHPLSCWGAGEAEGGGEGMREGEDRVADGGMWTASSRCTVAADSVVTAKPTAGEPTAVGMGAHHAKAERRERREVMATQEGQCKR